MDEQKEENFQEQLQKDEEAFVGKVFDAVLGAQMVQTAFIGAKLGWYDELAKAGQDGLTASHLAEATSCSRRYAREWLEHQAVAGWIACLNPNASSDERRFYIPKAHIKPLTDRLSESFILPFATIQGAFGVKAMELVDCYKSDGGISWGDIGQDAREQQAAVNRPFFMNNLGKILEESLGEDVAKKLKEKGGRIVDVGAGYGWSSIAMAKHFTASKVEAYDLDEPSIDAARTLIAEHAVADRVQAYCLDAADAVKVGEPADLVVALECVHDMSDPISVLRTMKELTDGQGTVIVMDERVREKFSTDPDPVDQAFYGFSCMCCLADGKSRPNSAETGAVMRPGMLRAYAQQAGFKDIEILPVENDFYRFYRLIAKEISVG